MKLTDKEVVKYWKNFRKECEYLLKEDYVDVIAEQIPMVDAVLDAVVEIERLRTTLRAIQKYAAERDFIIGMEIFEEVCRDALKEVQDDATNDGEQSLY